MLVRLSILLTTTTRALQGVAEGYFLNITNASRNALLLRVDVSSSRAFLAAERS